MSNSDFGLPFSLGGTSTALLLELPAGMDKKLVKSCDECFEIKTLMRAQIAAYMSVKLHGCTKEAWKGIRSILAGSFCMSVSMHILAEHLGHTDGNKPPPQLHIDWATQIAHSYEKGMAIAVMGNGSGQDGGVSPTSKPI